MARLGPQKSVHGQQSRHGSVPKQRHNACNEPGLKSSQILDQDNVKIIERSDVQKQGDYRYQLMAPGPNLGQVRKGSAQKQLQQSKS